MNWRRAITRHWQYKVAALFVAVLLWVTVTTDEQQEQAVPTRVDWQVRDSSYVLVGAPGQVNTVFQARMGELMSFVGNRPVLTYTIDDVQDTRMRVSLSTGMVEYGQAGNARPVAVRPSDVVLEFEPRVRRRVPVRPRVRLSTDGEYAVVDSPTVQPDTVAVSGAESEVEGIAELTTERVPLDGVVGRVSRDVPVRLPDDAPNVRADPAIVLVTVRVDSVVERTLRRPLLPRGQGRGAVALEPDSVAVRVRGPRSVMEGLVEDSVAAYVDLSGGVAEGGGAFDVSVRISGYPGLTASAEPARVEVRREGGP